MLTQPARLQKLVERSTDRAASCSRVESRQIGGIGRDADEAERPDSERASRRIADTAELADDRPGRRQ